MLWSLSSLPCIPAPGELQHVNSASTHTKPGPGLGVTSAGPWALRMVIRLGVGPRARADRWRHREAAGRLEPIETGDDQSEHKPVTRRWGDGGQSGEKPRISEPSAIASANPIIWTQRKGKVPKATWCVDAETSLEPAPLLPSLSSSMAWLEGWIPVKFPVL